MKKIILTSSFFLLVLNLSSQVTIGNGPTSNMIFDVLCNTWRPINAPANLNINDLLVDLTAMPTTVADFDCQNPQVCLGPIIVEEPIIYNSPFQFTLNSCTNVLVYATIENAGVGDIFFTTASVSSGVSDGYVVVGTGIEGINGLGSSFGFYSSAALPIPTIRGAVHVGTMGGVNVQAPKLLAVVSDTLDGAYAQIGMPFVPSAGTITAFSGQSHAIISRTGLGSYARIGHGSDILAIPLPPASIDIINEDGNLWIHAGSTIGNKANIGHVSNNNDVGGNISVIIADGGNNTDGNIDIKGGAGNLASVGHFSELDQNQSVSGSISVQAAGFINITGGSLSDSDAMIGHYSSSLNIPVPSTILVESAKGTTLNGGASASKAQIGHEAHIVDVASSTMTVGSGGTIALFGNDNGPAVIGHKVEDASGLINGGDINVQSGDLTLESSMGSQGWTGIGHFDNTGNSSIVGDIYITSDGGLSMKAGGPQSFCRIGHDALSKGGTIDILTTGDIELISGQVIDAVTSIICEDSIVVYTTEDILMQSNDGNVTINSIYNNVDIAAIGEIIQEKVGPAIASIDIIPFVNSDLLMRAGDDIRLTQELTSANEISINTDHSFVSAELWPIVSYRGDPFFLFGFNPLGGLSSPLEFDDTFGMLLIDANSTFEPICNIFELFASKYREVDGLTGTLNVGTNDMINLAGVLNRITIGDTSQATDSIIALKQTVNDINIDNTTLNLDSLFIKANESLIINTSTINTTQGMTLIADNKSPIFPLISSGSLSIAQSGLTSGISGINLYSESRLNNIVAGGFGGSTFNGMAHSYCNVVCSTEEWVFYYPFGTLPGANSYIHHYKQPNVALAIEGFDFDMECDYEKVKFKGFIEKNLAVSEIDIEVSEEGRTWQFYKEWMPPFHSVSLDLNGLSNYKFVRLSSEDTNGEKTYSEIKQISCLEFPDIKIYPQPASTELFIEEKENKTYLILDVYGNIVQKSTSPIDVSALASGMYFISNNSWIKPQKMVVAR